MRTRTFGPMERQGADAFKTRTEVDGVEMRPDSDVNGGAGSSIAHAGEEDLARADFHGLLAALLIRAPDAQFLQRLACAPPLVAANPAHPLSCTWNALRQAAGAIAPDAVQDEFDALFISPGTPQLNPYGSYYVTGFMNSQPLAALRADLSRFGIARASGVGEPEDHLAALCEVMRALIAGLPGIAPRPLDVQRRFFLDYLAPWYRRCLDDMRKAEGACFYRCVADFGLAFFDLEFEAYEIENAFDNRQDIALQEGN